MKKTLKSIALISLAVLASAMTLSSCVTDPNSPGLEYMPDMYRSPSIEPYVDYGEVGGDVNESLKMTRSSLKPPHYSVPYHGKDSAYVMMMLPYKRQAPKGSDLTHGLYGYDISDTSLAEYTAAAQDINPIVLTAENYKEILKKGKHLFEVNCQHCHGEKGDGNGPMVQSGAFPVVPNYNSLTIKPGQMFYSITYGKGLMGAQSPILNKEEIWTLVHYIQKLQDSKYPNFSDSTAVTTTDSTVAVASK